MVGPVFTVNIVGPTLQARLTANSAPIGSLDQSFKRETAGLSMTLSISFQCSAMGVPS